MKKVECIIRPTVLEEVKEALSRFGIHGMTVSQVMGAGLQRGRTETYRGSEYSINLLPKIKVEMVIHDKWVEEVVRIISAATRTGRIGDGKIFVYPPVEEAVCTRAGEKGEAAL